MSKPTVIPIDSRFRVGELTVAAITRDSVVVEAVGVGGGPFLSTTMSEGGTGQLNRVAFRVLSLGGGTAVLSIHPAK
ncbi:hypothetical protein [Streptomyces sp. G45]|uniref:hypothetical protein n=1 Tax=Streptomyces sp. G45 TaxID=3406627 RepID=UPI003C20C174